MAKIVFIFSVLLYALYMGHSSVGGDDCQKNLCVFIGEMAVVKCDAGPDITWVQKTADDERPSLTMKRMPTWTWTPKRANTTAPTLSKTTSGPISTTEREETSVSNSTNMAQARSNLSDETIMKQGGWKSVDLRSLTGDSSRFHVNDWKGAQELVIEVVRRSDNNSNITCKVDGKTRTFVLRILDCSSGACKNGGTCKVKNHNTDAEIIYCECKALFGGPKCERAFRKGRYPIILGVTFVVGAALFGLAFFRSTRQQVVSQSGPKLFEIFAPLRENVRNVNEVHVEERETSEEGGA